MDRREFTKLAGLTLAGLLVSRNMQDLATPKLDKSLEKRVVDNLNTEELKKYNFSENELKKFNDWVDSAMQQSAEYNKNWLIVDKYSHMLYLIEKGKVDSKYIIELGNPYKDKQIEGDCCTPEGFYKVGWKTDKTYWYKSFVINYPNKQDIKKGKTGSAIAIHGRGSGRPKNEGGQDWTRGCMALTKKDMDTLFKYINQSDNVLIVRYTNKFLDSPEIKILLDTKNIVSDSI